MLERESLPDRRRCITRTVKVHLQTVHFTLGFYDDGRPGEVWIDVSRAGTHVNAWAGATAKLMSLMLQYGVPMQELVDALAGHPTEFGEVPVQYHENIQTTVGILDTIVRSLALEHLARNIYDGVPECDSESSVTE